MRINFFTYLVLIMCISEKLFAQYTLSGSVTDNTGEPLPFSNIIVSLKKNSKNIGFSISDEKGFYQLKNLPSDSLTIEISSMGFESKKLLFFFQKSDTLHIILKKTTIELSEVIISVKKDIIQSKDTVSYNASSFSDSTEHNLEELLEKLPGFSVEKEKGTIKVNGKSIKKVYIDGEEISGNNYQLITKNMPSDAVDKIQVLSNFNDNILLKGVGESNDVVLNLTINKNRKNIVFGNSNIGIGNKNNFDTYANMFFLGNKFKVLNFVGYNNIGKYSLANRLMEDEPFGANETNFNQNILSQLRTINNSDLSSLSGLSSESIIKNDEGSISTQFSTKPHKNIKINGGIFFLNDTNNLTIERNTNYRFDSLSFLLQEKINYIKKPSTLDTHIGLDWQINKTSALHLANTFFKNNVANQNLTESNVNSFQNNAQQNTFRFGNFLTYTNRISDKKAFLLSVLHENKSNEESLKLNLASNYNLPEVGELKGFVSQSIQQKIAFYNSKATYFYSLEKGKIISGVGFVERKDELNTEMKSSISVNAKNSIALKNQYFFSFLNINYQFTKFDVFVNNEIGKINANVDFVSKKVYYLPTIGLKREGIRNFLLFSFKSSVNIPQIYDLTSEVIMTGTRNFEQGFNQNYAIGKNKVFLFNYQHTNFQSTFLSNLNLTYSINEGGYIQDLSFDKNYVISSKILNFNPSKRFQISNGNEYYFDKLRLKVKIKPSIFYSEYYNSVNSALNPYQLIRFSADLSLRSAFKSFNYFSGISFSRSNIDNKVNFQRNAIEKSSVFIDFYFKFHQLNGRFQNEVLIVRNKSTINKYLTSSFHIYYSFKKTPLVTDFVIRNIFDSKYFINGVNSDFYSNSESIRVIPRYFMLTLNYNFGQKNDK